MSQHRSIQLVGDGWEPIFRQHKINRLRSLHAWLAQFLIGMAPAQLMAIRESDVEVWLDQRPGAKGLTPVRRLEALDVIVNAVDAGLLFGDPLAVRYGIATSSAGEQVVAALGVSPMTETRL